MVIGTVQDTIPFFVQSIEVIKYYSQVSLSGANTRLRRLHTLNKCLGDGDGNMEINGLDYYTILDGPKMYHRFREPMLPLRGPI